MIIIDIAGWIINLAILGITLVIWMVGIFMFSMFISMIIEAIKRRKE